MECNGKYKSFNGISLKNRKWPNRVIKKPPIWCSVDLRDGNQALEIPMNVETKIKFFDMLVEIGFKQIEVGFPSSSQTEFDFIRKLIEENHVPSDVTLQVLCQARENLIAKTFESLKGCKKAIFHLYISTSPAQRKHTFGKSKEEIKKMAVNAVRWIKKYNQYHKSLKIQLEYSPESFTQTEIDFSLGICNEVMKEWNASPKNKVILNLPSTIECCMPNQFADLIEYFKTNIKNPKNCIISLHNHNDRGEGIAQCELGLLAGAQRVEGCLFGNGERTGNLDLVTVALNMFTQGVNPNLDFSHLSSIAQKFEEFTKMQIPPRSPYAGSLVFTAFSGSHQDAIRKALKARENMNQNELWDVPYIALDPHDIGREYEGIIRINSQSGKGGAAFILEQDYGIFVPKKMHIILGKVIKKYADDFQRELLSNEIYEIFKKKWLLTKYPLDVIEIQENHIEGERAKDLVGQVLATIKIKWNEKIYNVNAKGNGPLDAFVNCLKNTPVPKFDILDFSEHSIGKGSDTKAVAYVQIQKSDGNCVWGVGKSSNVGRAGIAAVVSALNFYE